MQRIIILFILLYGTNCFCQKENIGLEIGAFSHQLVNPNNTFEKNGVNPSISLHYILNISGLLNIQSGIKYRRTNHTFLDYGISFQCDFSNSELNQLNSWTEYNYVFHYVGIPVDFRRNFSNNSNHFFLQMGVEFLLNMKSYGDATINECGTNIMNSILDTQRINSLLIFSTGIGFEFQLKDQGAKYSIESEFGITANEYQLNKITGINSHNFRSMFIGIKLGARI